MSEITIGRIRSVLHDQFDDHIDLNDRQKLPPDQLELAFLSRSLAALAIRSLTGVDPATAGASVVDGFDDCGIDAIHFDASSDILYLVQSKWSGNEKQSFDEGAATKFVNGVKALLQAEFDRFNNKVKAKEAGIREALFASRGIEIRIVTIHTSSSPMPNHVRRVIGEFISSLNDPVQIAEHLDFDQSGVYEFITAESKPAKINIQAVLNDWGVIEKPFLAYYGRVSLAQILQWWRQHRNKLFSQNLRLFYNNSAVNDALKKTIVEDASNFWYFNNGITIIADRVTKGIVGSPGHKFGNFACEGASVVNGAQTVGTVGNSLDAESVEDLEAWVQVRLISLENCPPGFSSRITRATNLQNSVGTREFAAMDPLQHRLATEFALDKRRYGYKSGDADPRGEEGCSIAEATQAIGCAISVQLAVQVKREIGQIWADTESAPYTEIFNDRLGSAQVWRATLIMRAVDDELHRLKSSDVPRAEAVSSHMNRVILHLVHLDPIMVDRQRLQASDSDIVDVARSVVEPIYRKVSAYLEANHSTDYLAVFCKNTKKCEDLVRYVQRGGPPKDDSQGSFSYLFDL